MLHDFRNWKTPLEKNHVVRGFICFLINQFHLCLQKYVANEHLTTNRINWIEYPSHVYRNKLHIYCEINSALNKAYKPRFSGSLAIFVERNLKEIIIQLLKIPLWHIFNTKNVMLVSREYWFHEIDCKM